MTGPKKHQREIYDRIRLTALKTEQLDIYKGERVPQTRTHLQSCS